MPGSGWPKNRPPATSPSDVIDRHREVAADGQVALGHAVVGRAVAVARVREDVVEPDDPLAVERGGEDVRVARHREALERAAVHARERVEHVRLAGVGDHVVEEGAELRGGELARGVGGELDDLVQLQPARDRLPTRCSASARCFSRSSRRPVSSASTRAACSRVEQLERLDRVRRHLRELDDDRLVVAR